MEFRPLLNLLPTSSDLYIARGPKCDPQSAQRPSALQSVSIRAPPCITCEIASGVRTWNCAGPGAA
eukprot:1585281-Alexandrium_andersonii.AAC.1